MVQIIPLSQPSLVASHIINLSHSPACEDSPHSPSQPSQPSQPSLPSQLMSAVLIPYPIPFNRKSQVVDGRPCITPKWDEPDLSYYPGFHMGHLVETSSATHRSCSWCFNPLTAMTIIFDSHVFFTLDNSFEKCYRSGSNPVGVWMPSLWRMCALLKVYILCLLLHDKWKLI